MSECVCEYVCVSVLVSVCVCDTCVFNSSTTMASTLEGVGKLFILFMHGTLINLQITHL